MAGTDVIIRPPVEVASYDELKAQVQKLDQFYRGLMTKGTDYGEVPGTTRPTLLKSGAELLRAWAGLIPSFEVNSLGTEFERGIFNYQIKCALSKNGTLVGEGLGSCNSLESKYRYRWVNERNLPAGLDQSTLVSKENTNRQTGGKWRSYRIENDTPHDLANTILKMAKKRAFVDAILTVTGASRIFTQDVEDMDTENLHDVPVKPKTQGKARKPEVKADETTIVSQDGWAEVKDEEDKTSVVELKVETPADEAPIYRDPDSITTATALCKAAFIDFQLQPDQVKAELNIKSFDDMTDTPADCYRKLAAVYGAKE